MLPPNTAPALPTSFDDQFSPSRNFCSSIASSSSALTTSMSTLSSPTRSSSPDTRWGPPLVTIHRGCVSASTPVRLPIHHRNSSPDRSMATSSFRERNQSGKQGNGNKQLISDHEMKKCMCSPTTHAGSFRCRLHSNPSARNHTNSDRELPTQSYRLYLRRSAMTNSLVRIGTVEGDLVKRALASLTRPFSRQPKRRCEFQPRPSRLSVMSKAGD